MADHIDLGKTGEKLAAEYLQSQNIKILDQNWRFNRNEIDLVGIDKDEVVIFEIKTRHSNPFQEPEMAVNRDKQRALIRSGNAYVRLKRINKEVRFDIITVVFSGEEHRINHIRDAFYPTL